MLSERANGGEGGVLGQSLEEKRQTVARFGRCDYPSEAVSWKPVTGYDSMSKTSYLFFNSRKQKA